MKKTVILQTIQKFLNTKLYNKIEIQKHVEREKNPLGAH